MVVGESEVGIHGYYFKWWLWDEIYENASFEPTTGASVKYWNVNGISMNTDWW